jgi:hypothetical protein
MLPGDFTTVEQVCAERLTILTDSMQTVSQPPYSMAARAHRHFEQGCSCCLPGRVNRISDVTSLLLLQNVTNRQL